MKVGDLVQEDTEQAIGIVVRVREGGLNPISITVFSFADCAEQLWSTYHTEVISESR